MKKLFIIALLIYSLPVTGQWQLVYQTPTNEIVKVASSSDENTFWFITNFDRVYKTSNGGANWSVIVHPLFIPSGIFVLNKDTAFKTASQSLFRTVNGGESWSLVFQNGATTSPPEIWMKDNSTGVLSFAGQLYRTTDGGISWSATNITQPPFSVLNSSGKGILYSKNNDLWTCLAGHGVAYSSDFGTTWSLPSNTGAAFNGPSRIFFGSNVFGLAVISASSFVYATTNGASSWTQSDNSLGLNEDVAINDSHCWYIPNPADHFYVKYSQDSGLTWTQQLFDASGFNVLEKSRQGNALWAGTQTGKIYRYIDAITNVSSGEVIANGFRLEQNFPNPFNPQTDIGYYLPANTFVTLRIFDVSGKEISTVVNQRQSAGNHSVRFNGSNLGSGIYFYELKAGQFTETKKMTLIR